MSRELELETLDAPAVRRRARAEARVGLTLTVLYHPDAARIGEQAHLVGPTDLSRSEPGFSADGAAPRPLAFRGISRTPLRLAPAPGGWTVRGAVSCTVDGRETDEAFVDDETLARGVRIGLGGWVLLEARRGPGPVRDRERLGLVGVTPEIEALRERLERLATSALPVLLRGETGTGKELAARALHTASLRSQRRFLAVNLGAVTGDAAVSQLFGHERGAFTGADARAEGFFGMADGGTLLLDEIGEADDRLQPMLLRAIEANEIQPLGGRPRTVDVRLVFATDADLEQRVEAGHFRRALLYRVTQARVDLPPLRSRPADVPLQLVRFVRQLALAHGVRDPTSREGWLTMDLVEALVARRWPGNSRELRAVAARLVLECADQPRADLSDEEHRGPEPDVPGTGLAPNGRRAPAEPASVGEAEVRAALEAADFRLAVAAERLGIARNTLFARMAEYGIKRPKDLGPDDVEAARKAVGPDLEEMARHLAISVRALRLRMRELGL